MTSTTIQDFYDRQIRARSKRERRQLARLIETGLDTADGSPSGGTLCAAHWRAVSMFSWSFRSGDRHSGDNDRIHADLAAGSVAVKGLRLSP